LAEQFFLFRQITFREVCSARQKVRNIDSWVGFHFAVAIISNAQDQLHHHVRTENDNSIDYAKFNSRSHRVVITNRFPSRCPLARRNLANNCEGPGVIRGLNLARCLLLQHGHSNNRLSAPVSARSCCQRVSTQNPRLCQRENIIQRLNDVQKVELTTL
jgi:hypothetical protein